MALITKKAFRAIYLLIVILLYMSRSEHFNFDIFGHNINKGIMYVRFDVLVILNILVFIELFLPLPGEKNEEIKNV